MPFFLLLKALLLFIGHLFFPLDISAFFLWAFFVFLNSSVPRRPIATSAWPLPAVSRVSRKATTRELAPPLIAFFPPSASFVCLLCSGYVSDLPLDLTSPSPRDGFPPSQMVEVKDSLKFFFFSCHLYLFLFSVRAPASSTVLDSSSPPVPGARTTTGMLERSNP